VHPVPHADASEALARYSLLDALRGRRSRRFGPGMQIPQGPFAHTSHRAPQPLTELEEAALAFAACGITGYALADLAYGRGQGGSMLAGLVGRTVSSPDALNTVAVVVTNDHSTYLLKRPQDFAPTEVPTLIALSKQGDLQALYHRSRLKISDGRATVPVEPGYNFDINRWSLYAAGGTYFLPINELTAIYINALLEVLDESMGVYILDERAGLRPAGLGRFGKRKGGHLSDSAKGGRVATVLAVELSLLEGVAIEQGMVLQNLGLMAQALGLGGFPNFARHEYAWFKALGFRLGSVPVSRYLGLSWPLATTIRLFGRDSPVPFPLGLERGHEVLLKPYYPPYYRSMADAVRSFVDTKFGQHGTFRGGAAMSAWRDPVGAAAAIPAPSEKAVAATIAYCEYIYARYGRFPAYTAPFRTVLGYQATHVDVEFYDRFFHPEAISDTQRDHMAGWHEIPGLSLAP